MKKEKKNKGGEHSKKPTKSIKLIVRAPLPVITLKGYGWRKSSLVVSFVYFNKHI